MNKKARKDPSMKIWLLTFFILITGGCIEISEELTVDGKGGGTVSLTVRLDQAGSLWGGYLADMEMVIPENVKASLVSSLEKVRAMEGITGVEADLDPSPDGMIMAVVHFTDSRALNRALYHLAGKKKNFFSPGYIRIREHKIKKRNLAGIMKRAVHRIDELQAYGWLLPMVAIESTVRVPEPATGFSGRHYELSSDRRSLILKTSADRLAAGDCNTSLRCRY
ncbi:MAG: hypothetical protein JW861_13445 [Bacteroidales bacterium]|nr:hypothetical protein [Bacteroidales bacterium]